MLIIPVGGNFNAVSLKNIPAVLLLLFTKSALTGFYDAHGYLKRVMEYTMITNFVYLHQIK